MKSLVRVMYFVCHTCARLARWPVCELRTILLLAFQICFAHSLYDEAAIARVGDSFSMEGSLFWFSGRNSNFCTIPTKKINTSILANCSPKQ